LALAYLLINSIEGHEDAVVSSLRELPEVKEISSVQGEYDFVACLQANTMEEIKKIISWKIRRLDCIAKTATTIVVN
jgi:DNA-binding Lrp family transcriptional regulator